MTKIGIYNEPFGGGIGGSEYEVAVLAEALGKSHEVELVHHRSSLTVEALEAFTETDLGSVRLRYVAPVTDEPSFSRNLWQRYQVARQWQASLSAPYDLFICSLHGLPPFCHARRGVLMVLFPFSPAAYIKDQDHSGRRNFFRKGLSQAYYKWEWKRRTAGYQIATAISNFTRIWTQRRWAVDCQVINPPVDSHFRRRSKSNIVLSVGRFSVDGEGHGKKHLEMLNAFGDIYDSDFEGWKYFSVGTLGDLPKHQAYFDELRGLTARCHAELRANVDRGELKDLFERAKIFWHAAGYGVDEERHPELVEHFGIVTVEAMAAGCVPVVINKGAQGEIVEHGVSGYLWNTIEELKSYTRLLARDEQLRLRLSEAARERARVFSRDVFVRKFHQLLKPLLSEGL
jgi:glycosyltransferase involved in cell wall biosynthesis